MGDFALAVILSPSVTVVRNICAVYSVAPVTKVEVEQ